MYDTRVFKCWGSSDKQFFWGFNAFIKKKLFRANQNFGYFYDFWCILLPIFCSLYYFVSSFCSTKKSTFKWSAHSMLLSHLKLIWLQISSRNMRFFFFFTWCSSATRQGSHVGNRPSPVEHYPPPSNIHHFATKYFIDIASKIPQSNI